MKKRNRTELCRTAMFINTGKKKDSPMLDTDCPEWKLKMKVQRKGLNMQSSSLKSKDLCQTLTIFQDVPGKGKSFTKTVRRG